MKTFTQLVMLALVALLGQTARAADCAASGQCEAKAATCGCDPSGCGNGCCSGCGGCGKTCKLVSTTKKIVVNCYGVKEDQICMPCRSCEGCTNCESLCAKAGCGCNCEGGCRPDCHVRWTEYCPGDAQMYCRKKLVKYEAVKEIPWFKWVVVDCDCCGHEMGAPAPSPMPAPPKAAMTRPAPVGALVGMEYEVSEAEMKQLQGQVAMPAPAAKSAAAPAKSTGISKLVDFIR